MSARSKRKKFNLEDYLDELTEAQHNAIMRQIEEDIHNGVIPKEQVQAARKAYEEAEILLRFSPENTDL